MNYQKELFVCDCGDLEHQFVISKFPDENEIYISVHLSNLTFWKRLIIAVKYIFGKKSIYGSFEEIILNQEEKKRLIKILENE